MKQVGVVTGNQFGYLYIDGIPYNPTKVKRFIAKGAGIKLQDIVIYEAEGNVLDYIKNAIYKDGTEIRLVKEFVRSRELAKASIGTVPDAISDEIRWELAQEGATIKDGLITMSEPEIKLETCFKESELNLLPDAKRQLAIMLQSSMKIAAELNPGDNGFTERIKADTIAITRWIDTNSTRIL